MPYEQYDGLDIPQNGPRAAPPLSYRERQRRGADVGSLRLGLIAAVIGGGLVVVAGGWSLLNRGPAQVPVIHADARPLRVKPENPGGMRVAGGTDDLYVRGDRLGDALGAPAETPNPAALRAQRQADVATQAAANQPLANQQVGAQAAMSPPATMPMPQPAARADWQDDLAAPAAPVQMQAPAPQPAPRASAASTPQIAAPAINAPMPMPVPLAAPASAPVQAAATAAPRATSAPGHALPVQLAAVPSESAAHAEWARLVKRMPDLLGGRKPDYLRVDRDGHSFWRLRLGGFVDENEANTFCEKVRAEGSGCSIARF